MTKDLKYVLEHAKKLNKLKSYKSVFKNIKVYKIQFIKNMILQV